MFSAHHKAQMSKAKTLAAQAVAKPWTDQEILLLLEGLEMYKVSERSQYRIASKYTNYYCYVFLTVWFALEIFSSSQYAFFPSRLR